ncbi:M10 family metallopeptidase C-terminal domain-containing protein [Ensifer adhaerens]|uniref:M10 family metallopeptidase C-terminal domain-containing protein n=1 Tax=Ensifer adhaerens TaxID=106592 RepID=UPI003CC7F3EF
MSIAASPPAPRSATTAEIGRDRSRRQGQRHHRRQRCRQLPGRRCGADIFVFRSLAALANGGEGRDEIRDFEVGDRIDLSKIAEALGGLAFAPFADDGSPAPVNRITFYHETFSDSERTVVRAVIDLERDEDLEFLIAGRHALTEQDFILAAFETAAEQRDA